MVPYKGKNGTIFVSKLLQHYNLIRITSLSNAKKYCKKFIRNVLCLYINNGNPFAASLLFLLSWLFRGVQFFRAKTTKSRIWKPFPICFIKTAILISITVCFGFPVGFSWIWKTLEDFVQTLT